MYNGTTTPLLLVTGIAGSGKTRLFKDKIQADPAYGVLCATTGVSAVNLGAQTIHSFMGYSDLDDMRRTVQYGGFTSKLKKLYDQGDLWPGAWVVIDEKSMLNAEQLDVTFEAFESFNKWLRSELAYGARYDFGDEGESPIPPAELVGLAIVGDFCQLPPVDGEFAFKSRHWPKFESNHINLTGSYRQSSGGFLDALNLARSGKGSDSSALLKEIGIEFSAMNDMHFDGVTIFGTNKDVDWFNQWRYSHETGEEFFCCASRSGQQKKEWLRRELVPDSLNLRVGCRVMITANSQNKLVYANGDMGVVIAVSRVSNTDIVDSVTIRLDRTNGLVEVVPCEREWIDPRYKGPKWKAKADGFVIGSVSYMPLKLGYALTVHKTQGLSLDRVQYNISHPFTGGPAMSYTALSRARTPDGLRIIGTPSLLASRITTHPAVSRWL